MNGQAARCLSYLLTGVTALLLTCGTAAYCLAEGPPRSLTLPEALGLADRNNHDLAKAREFGRQVQGKYVEERAAALPHLSLNGQLSRQEDDSQALFWPPLSGAQDSRSLSVGLSQALFTWGKLGAAIRAAKKGFLTADDELRQARADTRQAVSVAFYDLLLAKEEANIARRNLNLKQTHLDKARRRRDLGVATDYDVLAAKVAAENARPQVIHTENQVGTARDRLKVLTGSQEEIDAQGPLADDDSHSPLPSYGQALARALKRRPDLDSLLHRQEIADELINIAKAEDKPRLDLNADYGRRQLEVAGYRGSGPAWDAGVTLSFPFFDGMKARGKVAQAKSDRRGLTIDAAKLKDEIGLEIRTALAQARETREIETALAGTAKQAGQLLEMAERGQELGVKTRLEVEDAELNLMQAQTNLARARRDHLTALVALKRAMGTLDE